MTDKLKPLTEGFNMDKPMSQTQKNAMIKKALVHLSESIFVLMQKDTGHNSVGPNNIIQGHLKEVNDIVKEL